VLTHEAIEVHLSYLRPAVEEIRAELPVLREKIEALSEKLSGKIDQANKDRATGDAMLAEKIDQANKDRATGDAMLAEKIDQANKDRAAGDIALMERVMKIQSSLEGLKWFISSLALIVSGISIAHSLGWI